MNQHTKAHKAKIVAPLEDSNRLCARIHQLEDALRRVTTVRVNRPDGRGGYVVEKVFCEICEAECGPDQDIHHVGGCPLTCLNPST